MYDPTQIQPPRASAGASVVLLCVCALTAVAGVAMSLGMLDLIKQMESGAEVTLERGLAALAMTGLQMMLFFLFYALTGVFFLAWMYKAVKFARSVAPEANRTSPAWAAWSLILPVAAQIVPMQAAHAAYTSCTALERRKQGRGGDGGAGLVVMTWGGLWALMFLGYIALQFIGQANPFVEGATAAGVRTFWQAFMGWHGLVALTAVAGATMVMKVTAVQGRVAALGLSGAGGASGEPALTRGGLPGMPASMDDDEPAPARGGLPGMPAVVEDAPPTSPGGLPGMPAPAAAERVEPAAATEPEPAQPRAGLPGMPAGPVEAAAEQDEPTRQFMPGIPPPPSQNEAA